MVTIKDVALHARVSYTTVSHVVNGSRVVATRTRERVLRAIEELRYVPSATARSLKTRRTGIVGMIMPNNSNPYFAGVIRGVEDVCYQSGFNLILCNSDDDPHKQSRYVRVLHERQVEGLIVLTSGEDEDLYHLLLRSGLPHVIVDREAGGGSTADLVQVDHELGSYQAASHLLELGHRRIACIAGPLILSSARQRVAGYRQALAEAGVDAERCPMRESDFSSAGGYSAMLELMALPTPCTAVFVCNDLMAIGALGAAASVGLHVPQDVSVVGFDDIALARYTNPPLTTVAQPMNGIGRTAAEILIARIATPGAKARQVRLLPELHVRGSSGPRRRSSVPGEVDEREHTEPRIAKPR